MTLVWLSTPMCALRPWRAKQGHSLALALIP